MSRIRRLKLPQDPAARLVVLVGAAAVAVLTIAGLSIGGSYALTLHQIAVNHANHAATEQRQARQGCQQFGGLVDSIIAANNQTQHAVTKSKSFGELFTVGVRRYYAGTGCDRYFKITGGGG